MSKQSTYTDIEIEIADAIFANPAKDVSVIVSEYVSKCQKSERTVWRWVKKAQEYNKTRQKKKEEVREKVLVRETEKEAKKAILSRNKALEILTEIAEGKTARSIQGEVLVPSDSERIRAIDKLAEIEGWDAPVKNAQTDSEGNDVGNKIVIEVVQVSHPLNSSEDEIDV